MSILVSYFYADVRRTNILRKNYYVFNFFCEKKDFDEFMGDGIKLMTPEQVSSKWTTWKDAMIHDIMNSYNFEKGAQCKFRVFDRVYGGEVCFWARPEKHSAFFCDCYIGSFLTNQLYEQRPVTPVVESADLYCHETM